MAVSEIISNVIISIALVLMVFGIFGLFRFKDYYHRLLIIAKIDTVSMITLLVGFIVRHGFSAFSAKLLLLLVIVLVLNPLVAHVMVRSAYRSGYRLSGQLKAEKDDEAVLEEDDDDKD
ncbi:MAG: monovalent cation/H(+) antiporter subunit G [Spirochaetes bacterium]|nr:monovalent cation/H(+) antiporter subunit G [Spirochaetota bacterium]